MANNILILGSTGLLGQALCKEAKQRKLNAVGIARSRAQFNLDITDTAKLTAVINQLKPDTIINAAAEVNLGACSTLAGWEINTRLVANLAMLAKTHNSQLVQISTDHFFTGDGNNRHAEDASVALLNDYAIQKYAAETLALTWKKTLTVRTNIVGLRHSDTPTFAEWVLDIIKHKKAVTLFSDMYTSSIDTGTFARALFDLIEQPVYGRLNLAAREVFSKYDFVTAVAAVLGTPLRSTKIGSCHGLQPPRAESLGLDVTRAEALLGYRLPTLQQVAQAVVTAEVQRPVAQAKELL